MLFLGCHLSTSKGLAHAVRQAKSIDGNTFQFFTRNPRGSKAKQPDPGDLQKALSEMEGFGPLVLHGAYTMNLCTREEVDREFAGRLLADDLSRAAQIPGSVYNFHPGSHVGQGRERGIEYIAHGLNRWIPADHPGFILLETMAGKGSEIGGRFEDLRDILDRVEHSEKMGVCMDLCHIWDSGYDIRNFDAVLEEFHRIVGIDRLKAIHVNDSMNPLGARKDRHAPIGEGCIGKDILYQIVHHPALANLPMILETPNELPGYGREIAYLRGKN